MKFPLLDLAGYYYHRSEAEYGPTEQDSSVTHYQKRIWVSLIDLIEIHMQVPRVKCQRLRDMRPAQIRKYCVLDEPCQILMKTGILHL